MNWLNEFIIPLVLTIFIFGFVAVLLYFVIKATRILWSIWLRHFIKYRILGSKFTDIDTLNQLKLKDNEIRSSLLISGFKKIRINELLYIKNLIGKKQNQPKKKSKGFWRKKT